MRRQDAAGVKVREDLARYRLVVALDRPDVVVECGTYRGGSAAWFAGLGVDVVTVDVEDCGGPAHPRVTRLLGDSADPAVVERVAGLVAGRRTMAVLDSDHAPFHVRREIEAYGPLVTAGCHLVVEDTLLRWVPSPFPHPMRGPLDAVEHCLAGDPRWARDVGVEGLFDVSMSPAGWWVRTVEAG